MYTQICSHLRIVLTTLPSPSSDKRQLSFRTARFGSLALIQDTHINMPFQSWEIRPRGANHAVFTIIAAIVEVEIQIKVCYQQMS